MKYEHLKTQANSCSYEVSLRIQFYVALSLFKQSVRESNVRENKETKYEILGNAKKLSRNSKFDQINGNIREEQSKIKCNDNETNIKLPVNLLLWTCLTGSTGT